MSEPNLKPWTLGPLATAVLGGIVLFFVAIAVLMISTAPSLQAALATKLLIVVLAGAGVGCAVSTLMWSRHWKHVQWNESFWAFVSGPPPEYEEAALAWRWGRRSRVFWLLMAGAMIGIIVIERVSGRWS